MTDNSSPAVAIIILNYQGLEDTLACVGCVELLPYPSKRIIVVDNHSQDGSVEKIRASRPEITVLETGKNLGFSGGNNVGIQYALQDPSVKYIWLLNNDTTVYERTLLELVEMAQAHPKSLVGSLIRYPDGRFQRVGTFVNRFFGSLKSYSEKRIVDGQPVESLSGCSMLIPRKVFETIGMLGLEYFLYFEDMDFCMRATQAGFTHRVAKNSEVYHAEGATTGRNAALVTYYYQRNRLILAQKFFHPLQLRMIQLYTHYRLFRSTIKAALKNTPDVQRHHMAFQLAVSDFYSGTYGKCPHEI